jgi:hypothetical protein
MTEERLSALATLAIERELANSLDMDVVVDTFARIPSLRKTNEILQDCSARRLALE